MAAGGRDVSMKDTDATDRIAKRKSDELAAFYSSKAADGSKGAKEREGSMLFSVAEAHTDDEDYDAALRTAQEALVLFQDVKDVRGEADTIRLIVHAHLGKSEEYRWTERGDPSTNLAGQTEREAESVTEKGLETFRKTGNMRGEACMLLSLAEITWFRRDLEKRERSFDMATDAHDMFKKVGDKKFEAIAKQALTCINLQRHKVDDALKLSEEAVVILQDIGESKEEAVSLHLLACSQIQNEKWSAGLATANESLKLFRALGLQTYVGFELVCIAHWLLHQDKARDALPIAKEAQTIFQELDLGRGWQAAAVTLVMDAHIAKADKSAAMRTATEEIERFQASGDRRSEIVARMGLVKAHIIRESPAEAMQENQNALEVCREIADRRWEACMLINAAHLHRTGNAFDLAAAAADEAREIFQELDDKSEEARAGKALYEIHMAKMDFRMAAQTAGDTRRLHQEDGDVNSEAGALLDSAVALVNGGSIKEGMSNATEAQSMFQDMSSKRGEGSSWQIITQVHLGTKMHDLALQAAQKMQALFEDCDDPKMQCAGIETLSHVHSTREEFEEAVVVANHGRNTARKTENRQVEVKMLICLTNANVDFLKQKIQEANSNDKDLGRAMFDKALKPAKEAVMLAKKLGSTAVIASAVFALSQMLCIQGRHADALKAADDCLSLYKSISNSWGEIHAVFLQTELHWMNEDLDLSLEAANKVMQMCQAVGDQRQEAQAKDYIQRIKQAQSGGAVRPTAVAGGAIDAVPVKDGQAASVEAPAASKGLSVEFVGNMIKTTLMASIGADEEPSVDVPLMEAGMDSLSMVAFRNALQRESGMPLPASTMFDYPTMRGLTDHLVERSLE